MSSVTPNIGLVLPDGSENVSRQVINDNYTKIDTAFANVGNSTMREVPFNIPTSAWTLSSGVYTAEFTTAYVTASSKEIGTYTSSLRQYAKADIDMAKKSGGGGMVFTTTTAPTGTISGSLYIWDNDDGKVPIVVEGTVIPISNGGTGGNDLSTAKSNLGITAVENQTSANTQAIANLGNNIGMLSSLKTSAKTSAVNAINEVLGLAQCRRIYIGANGSIDIAVPDGREIYFLVCPSTGDYYLGAVNGNSNTITKIAGSATASKLTATRGSYKITLTSSQTWGMLVYVLAPFSTTGGV